jgi:glycosyltransferase involved in cell wall biosynthesis
MKICLLTPGQPSTNPRLVKEADALSAAGFEVTVVYAHWADWAAKTDADLLARRRWSHVRVGGDPVNEWRRYWLTRLRHGLSRRAFGRVRKGLVPRDWHLCRVAPELVRAAERMPADLYIAHNLGALPAAIAGARKFAARAGFDAEDFHSGMVNPNEATSEDAMAEEIESSHLPACAYVTAASPAMSQAYARKYRIDPPTPILNVFPLEERPYEFRATSASGPLRLYWFSQTIGAGRGLEDAIRAMGMLGTPDVELYLQGEWAPGYRQELERQTAAAGLDSRQLVHLPVEAPSGMVRRAAVYDVGLALEQPRNQNRDVTVTNKIFTYVLAGNAVAATATAGQQPIIERIGAAGACYAPGDAAGLARCLERWRSDRTSLDASRRLAWEWGTRVFNWDFEKNKFLDVIQHALARPLTYA